MVCSIPQEVGQGQQYSVGGFQEGRNRRSGFLDKRIVPPDADVNQERMLGTEISDNLPQMEAAQGHHSTHGWGIGNLHKERRFCHGMGQHNSHWSDVHSARARHRKEDGPGDWYVRMSKCT